MCDFFHFFVNYDPTKSHNPTALVKAPPLDKRGKMAPRITEEKTVKEALSQHGCNGLISNRNH